MTTKDEILKEWFNLYDKIAEREKIPNTAPLSGIVVEQAAIRLFRRAYEQGKQDEALLLVASPEGSATWKKAQKKTIIEHKQHEQPADHNNCPICVAQVKGRCETQYLPCSICDKEEGSPYLHFCPNCYGKNQKQTEQRGFEDGKRLSKEVHCQKHGWACNRCESCEKEAYEKGKKEASK